MIKIVHYMNNAFAAYCFFTNAGCRVVGAAVVAIVAFINRKKLFNRN